MKSNKISMSQLAKICNVSQGTVDRALHNRPGISNETRARVLEAVKKYGYRPDSTDNDDKNRLIGIIVFDLYNEFFSQLIVEIEKQLRACGYCSLVMFSDKDKNTELECIEKMYNAGVDGIIICPVNFGDDFSKYLFSWNIPVVTVGNRVEGLKYVGVDNFAGMQSLTEIIIDKGYKNIVYYSPALKYKNVNLYGQNRRYNGFLKAVENYPDVQFSVVKDETEFPDLSSPYALIASTDYYALKLRFSGNAEPSLIAGFDNIGGTDFLRMPYITVDCNISGVAGHVVEYITGNADDKDVFVPHKIIYKNL